VDARSTGAPPSGRRERADGDGAALRGDLESRAARVGRRRRRHTEGKLGDAAVMIALMLVDTPDDRYRGHQRGTPWGRVVRLLAAAVACFVAGAFILPWVGFLLDIGAVALVLLALCALDG
jgi:Flp pilus assembly protein TadB